ncbi:MAG: hypothetical protein LBI45_06145 [Bacteroidales bacterium]|jgi:hypothetical protein|nr:hypothetical protein [Bacteroidales bacterium]
METKRKPKGSEGGSLQIRDLDAETLIKLQELQKFFGVGTSSKAVLLAVKNFLTYKNETHSLRSQLAEARDAIREQSQALAHIQEIIKTCKNNRDDYDNYG